jgi:hypothetical protein
MLRYALVQIICISCNCFRFLGADFAQFDETIVGKKGQYRDSTKRLKTT